MAKAIVQTNIQPLALVLILSAMAPAYSASNEADQAAPLRNSPSINDQSAAPALDEIVVTAQKRSERINDVPESINAATGDQLQKLGITDTADLTKIVPGFTYQAGAFGVPVFGIRGISFYDPSAIASPAVSVYVDQIPLPYSILTAGAVLDVQRVEVLKGPQGTLFGENSSGGAINFIANKPTDSFEAGTDLTYGRFNEADIGGYVSGPVIDTITARFSFRSEHRGDWQYSTSRDATLGQRNFNEARLLIDWKPTSDFRAELNVNGYVDKSDTQAPQYAAFVPVLPGPAGYQVPDIFYSTYKTAPANPRAADWDADKTFARDSPFWQTALHLDYNITSDIALTSLSSFIHFDGVSPIDDDGSSYTDGFVSQNQHYKIFTQELRVSGTTGPLKWLLGGNYEHDNLREDANAIDQATNSIIAGHLFSAYVIRDNQQVSTKAGFGNLDYDLGHGLAIQGGVRYTSQNRTYHGCTNGTGGALGAQFDNTFAFLSTILSGSLTTLGPTDCITMDPQTFKPVADIERPLDEKNTSWRIGVDWKITSDNLVYANVTKGYKAGAFITIPTIFTSQVSSVDQESVLAYEAGFKSTLLARTMQVNGAIFYYDYKNKQVDGRVLVEPLGDLPALANVPASRVEGAEFDITWQPITQLKLRLSGTYVDSRVTGDYVSADPLGNTANFNGEALPATPKWQGSADAEYDVPVSSTLTSYFGGTVTAHSSSNALFGNNPDFKLPGYTVLDLRAGVASVDDRWNVELFGRNVADRYYWTNVEFGGDTVARLAGFPATYGVRFALRYK